jgi:phospholipid/cholesterol/gamma-HCH transport system permease protein
MTTVLTLWSGAVSVASGMITAEVIFGVMPRTFWNLSLVHASDLLTGITKCIAFGAAIPIVSSHCGLSTFGGSEGVGSATTRAVVQSSLAVIILNLMISTAAFIAFK